MDSKYGENITLPNVLLSHGYVRHTGYDFNYGVPILDKFHSNRQRISAIWYEQMWNTESTKHKRNRWWINNVDSFAMSSIVRQNIFFVYCKWDSIEIPPDRLCSIRKSVMETKITKDGMVASQRLVFRRTDIRDPVFDCRALWHCLRVSPGVEFSFSHIHLIK